MEDVSAHREILNELCRRSTCAFTCLMRSLLSLWQASRELREHRVSDRCSDSLDSKAAWTGNQSSEWESVGIDSTALSNIRCDQQAIPLQLSFWSEHTPCWAVTSHELKRNEQWLVENPPHSLIHRFIFTEISDTKLLIRAGHLRWRASHFFC